MRTGVAIQTSNYDWGNVVKLPKLEAAVLDNNAIILFLNEGGKTTYIEIKDIPDVYAREIVHRCNAVPDLIKTLETLANMKSYRLGRFALKIHPCKIAQQALTKFKGDSPCHKLQTADLLAAK